MQRVVRAFQRTTNQLVHLFIGKDTIHTTPEHPFFVPQEEQIYASTDGFAPSLLGQGSWVLAKNLRKGIKVFLFSTLLATVDSTFTQDTICTVYNFEVERMHNYFVGKERVLVHNSCWEKVKDVILYFDSQKGSQIVNGFSKKVNDIALYKDLERLSPILKGMIEAAEKSTAKKNGLTNFLRRAIVTNNPSEIKSIRQTIYEYDDLIQKGYNDIYLEFKQFGIDADVAVGLTNNQLDLAISLKSIKSSKLQQQLSSSFEQLKNGKNVKKKQFKFEIEDLKESEFKGQRQENFTDHFKRLVDDEIKVNPTLTKSDFVNMKAFIKFSDTNDYISIPLIL